MDVDLYALAAHLGVTVDDVPLPADRDGEYDHGRRAIRLRQNMTRRLHRTVLAHECAHAFYGDTPTTDPVLGRRQERRADEWGARALIDDDGFRAAELLHDGHAGAMAVELGVTTEVVECYRTLLARRSCRSPHQRSRRAPAQ